MLMFYSRDNILHVSHRSLFNNFISHSATRLKDTFKKETVPKDHDDQLLDFFWIYKKELILISLDFMTSFKIDENYHHTH